MSGDRIDWRDSAACLGEETDLFFPIGTGPRAEHQIAEAKAVCEYCPVKVQCAKFASDHGYDGVWGGLDRAERRAVRANGRRLVGA